MMGNLRAASLPMRRRSARGFTLVELMVAITIVGILMAIAIPSFQQATLSSQLRTTANNLLAATILARSEAIKRNAIVQLCPSADSITCVGTWEQGWIVSCPTNDNIMCATGGASRLILQVEAAAGSGIRVIAQGGASVVNFNPTGAALTTQTFKICRQTPLGKQERMLTISAMGRGSITRTATGICP
jgi:type IV fimbrial biogenesis protein FimT